jgi:hypothetical protein
VHQVQLYAAAAQVLEQAGDHGVERQAEVVVADPVLEEVAEDVQRARSARLAFQKLDEALVRLRPLLGEVQVGDEQGGHYGAFTYFWVTRFIDSMTIGWRGTSFGPVGVLAIFITTSMPDTTLPNTA